MQNTRIEYRYRDESNNHIDTTVIVQGTFSAKQCADINTCLHNGFQFIPSQVGLPENRFNDGFLEQDDGVWFELYPDTAFTPTNTKPTENISTKQLYEAFMRSRDNWNEKTAMDRLISTPAVDDIDPVKYTNISIKEYMDILLAAHDATVAMLSAATKIPFLQTVNLVQGTVPAKYEELDSIAHALHLDEAERNTMFDIFGKHWNQFGIPLDIVHFIRNTSNATNRIRTLF